MPNGELWGAQCPSGAGNVYVGHRTSAPNCVWRVGAVRAHTRDEYVWAVYFIDGYKVQEQREKTALFQMCHVAFGFLPVVLLLLV